ncbi:MAG: PqqD family protein [Bacilli bacterium]
MDKKYKFAPCIAWQMEPKDEIIYILNNKKNEFIYFTDVSKDIWLLLNEHKSVRDIITLLSKIYEVEVIDIEEDILQFINNLSKEGVIISHE